MKVLQALALVIGLTVISAPSSYAYSASFTTHCYYLPTDALGSIHTVTKNGNVGCDSHIMTTTIEFNGLGYYTTHKSYELFLREVVEH